MVSEDCENWPENAIGFETGDIRPIRPGMLAADESGCEWWTITVDDRGRERREQVEAW